MMITRERACVVESWWYAARQLSSVGTVREWYSVIIPAHGVTGEAKTRLRLSVRRK